MSSVAYPAHPSTARREPRSTRRPSNLPGTQSSLLHTLDRLLGMPTLAAAAFALLVYLWMPKSMADPDIWWHLRDVAVQWQMHGWLHRDVLSATAHGAPWINHEWLAEVPFYLGWTLAGPRGVLVVSMAVTEAVMLLTFLLCWRYTRNTALTLVFSSLAALDATVSFGPRTLLFGWLCLNLELLLIEQWSAGRLRPVTALWAFPALFACWVNLHGSWLIGMLLLAAFLVSNALMRVSESPAAARWQLSSLHHLLQWPRRRDRSLWHAAGLSACALLLNPYGWRLVAYPFDLAFKQTLNIASVQEWQSLDFHTPRAKIFLLTLFVLCAVQLLRRTRWALWELVYVAIGIYAAFAYSRFLFLAALLVCPIVAKQVSQCLRPRPAPAPEHTLPGWRALVHAALIAAMLTLAASRFPAAQTMAAAERVTYPVGAVAALRSLHPNGPVFNQYIWGGFLEYHAPNIPVFVDSRVDIFERNGTFKDYLDVTQLRHPLETLDRRGIRYVLFEPDAPLVLLLKATGRWNTLYEDTSSVLLERTP